MKKTTESMQMFKSKLSARLFICCYCRDLDEMLSSLGVAPVSEVLSSLSSVASDQSANHTPDASLQPNALNNSG